MISQIKDGNILNRIFILSTGSCFKGRDFGVQGGKKTLAWGFVMATHPLCVLVIFDLC